jgi:acyl-CoA reductase-like NAD-dependent aldehyde dehydrogenase
MANEGINIDPKSYTKLYLNGQYVSPQSGKSYPLYNPKDGATVVDAVPVAGPKDVDLAVEYAEKAFNGPWRSFSGAQRTECFLKLAKLIDEHLVDILTLDSHTSGNPTSIIPTREKTYIKNTITYYAGWTDKQSGDYFPADDGTMSCIVEQGIQNADETSIELYRIHEDRHE